MKSRLEVKDLFLENLSYKVVSLFIAVILWVTIMGRRDLILTKNVEIEFKTAAKFRITGQTTDQIRLRLSGPRSSLKEVMSGTKAKALVLDISDRGAGVFDIDIPVNRIELPQGVRVLGVRPNLVRVEVVQSP